MDSTEAEQSTDVLTLEEKVKKKKKTKVQIEWEPEIYNPKGIFINGNAFLCRICNRLINLEACKSHSNGKEHCRRFSQITKSYSKVDGLYVCKLCPSYMEIDWKKYLIHFKEQKHLVSDITQQKQSNDQNKKLKKLKFSYVILEMSQIIMHQNGAYFCCCCGKIIGGWKSVVDHIDEIEHREKQESFVYDYEGVNFEEESQKLITNYLSHISKTLYYCYLCERLITGRGSCYEHIRGTEHTKLKGRIYYGWNVEKHVINYQPLYEILKQTNNPTTISVKAVQKTLVPNPLAELMRVNLITGPHQNGTYRCKLCGCVYLDFGSIRDHVSGKRHKRSMKEARSKTSLESESEEISSGSLSGSYVSIEKSSYSWKSYNDDAESLKSSEDSSKLLSWENLDNGSSSSWEKVDIKPTLSDFREPRPFEVPDCLVPLIDEHLLRKKRKEYYCVACKAHLRDLRSLLEHTGTKKHVSSLARFRAKATSKNGKLSATSEASSPVNPPLLKDEEPADTPEQETTSISLEPHELKHFEDDILCLACNIHFTDANDYMLHIRGESHRAALDKYRTGLSDEAKSTAINSSIFNIEEKPSTIEETEKTMTNISEHFKDDITCVACNVHFTHVDKYLIHINSEDHRAMLDKYRTGLLAADKSTARTLKKNIEGKQSTSNSQNIATAVETTNSQNPKSNLMHLPENVLPLIAIHSLNHFETLVYCPACKVQMRDAGSVVSHTNSGKHAAKLGLFTAKTSSEDTEILKALHLNVAEANRELELVKQTLTDNSDPKLIITRMARLNQRISVLESSVNKLKIADLTTEDSGIVKKKLPQKTLQSSKYQRMNWEQRQNNIQTRGYGFDPKIDMKHIYKEDPEKLRILELSCELSFPKTSKEIYCLVCERIIINGTQKFYEHLSSTVHMRYLNEMVENDRRFISYPEQFSDLTLAKEFIQQTSVEETLQCLACDIVIENDDLVISEHSKQDSHKERKQNWNLTMERWILQKILTNIERTWYNIQKYWCQPCGANCVFNTEFDFAEHISTEKHDQTVIEKSALRIRPIYDGCVPCATLWLGFANTYTEHCKQPMHRYLLQTGDYSVCTLPGQVKTLLENSEAEVDKLIEQSDPVLTVQKVSVEILLKCLEDTVKSKFPNAKAHPFGSRVSGLGSPDSDIDVFLDCGTYNGVENTKKLQSEIIDSVEACLLANQQSWEIEEILKSSRTPIIKLRHRSTELNCDVSFKNGLSVENTKLLKCFIDNYPLCRKLMLLIKKWLCLCNLSGSQYITNYAICWCVIFYLQSKSILPSVGSMISKKNKSKIIDGWETGISETIDEYQEEYTFAELLHGFFLFYASFDYHYSVACPIIGSSIPKRDFAELDLLPEEMKPYVKRISANGSNGPVELFRIDSEMCIQDPYDLSHNLTKAVKKFTLNRFKRLCAASVDILDNF